MATYFRTVPFGGAGGRDEDGNESVRVRMLGASLRVMDGTSKGEPIAASQPGRSVDRYIVL